MAHSISSSNHKQFYPTTNIITLKQIKNLKSKKLLISILTLGTITSALGCAAKHSNPLLNHSINQINIHEKGYLGPIGVGFLDAVCINLSNKTTQCASFIVDQNRNIIPGDTITGKYVGYHDDPSKALGEPDAVCEERGKHHSYYITGEGDITVGFDQNIEISEIESIDIYTMSEDCSLKKGTMYISIKDRNNQTKMICSGTGHIRCSQSTILESIK